MRVWNALRGYTEVPNAVRLRNGWWAVIDLQRFTGHNCDDKKLRELNTIQRHAEARGEAVSWRLETKAVGSSGAKLWRLVMVNQKAVQGALALDVKVVHEPDWRKAP